MASQKRIIEALMQRHGRTFASELGVDLRKNTPSPLFRLLCYSLLTSAPISADLAMRGARAMAAAGWTTPRKLQASDWASRARVLNEAGYARVDEKTATQLADMNAELLDTYAGDLRKLREAAAGSPKALRKRLKAFKGIGGTGADIFLREIQTAWDECYPYADKAALSAADKLGLKADAAKLADKVSREDYPRLMAALVRCKLAKDTQGVLEAAKA
ncbi:MAG: hypothetical protein CMN25_14625 [Salinicola sp.]|uniref:hypothetical protein n=1 Tax=uncultured Salinicola sp. TaxID=1193542 RepID=UPI000C995D2C|nr:hypothetical protein [uncultured Salinicola sp.]MAM58560.1 hypothetical protein [Salinicola sp.]